MKIFFRSFLIFLFCSLSSFSKELVQKKPIIVSSINPIYQIALAIAGNDVDNILIVDPSFSPHDYQIKKDDVAAVEKANLIFYVDNNLEQNFVRLIHNSKSKSKSYSLLQAKGMHILQRREIYGKVDSHIWLNPENAIKIAKLISQKLSEIDVQNSEKYQANFEIFKERVKEVEKKIISKLKKVRNSKLGFVFYHDGYQYFEDYFDIHPLKVMSYDHHKDLAIKDMRRFDLLVKEKRVKCVFGSMDDEKNSAKKLAKKYNLKFIQLDLIGTKEDSYIELINKMADDLELCFKD